MKKPKRFLIEKKNVEYCILPIKADIQQVGSSSVLGALARFDVDIQFEGRLYSEYKKAKREFLGENGKINFLK